MTLENTKHTPFKQLLLNIFFFILLSYFMKLTIKKILVTAEFTSPINTW